MIHVFQDDKEPGGYYIEEKIKGNTISDVLSMTQFDSNDLVKRVKAQVNKAIRKKKIRPSEGVKLIDDYQNGLADQTYLVFDD